MSSFQSDNYKETFKKLEISDDVISNIEFEDCVFVDCRFPYTTFLNCKFLSCTFDTCLLSNIKPTDSKFIDSKFISSKAIGIDWTLADTLQNLEFDKCQVNYSNFRLLKLPKIKFTNSDAIEVDFTETELSEADLSNTNFENTIFLNTDLSKVNFRNAKSYYINPKDNKIKGAIFSMPEAITLLDGLDINIANP